jgi:hypothetical protein
MFDPLHRMRLFWEMKLQKKIFIPGYLAMNRLMLIGIRG